MKKCNFSEFEEYFNKNLIPLILPFERTRKLFLAIIILLIILGIFISIKCGLWFINATEQNNSPIGMYGCVIGGIMAGIILPTLLLTWIYKNIIKNKLYTTLFAAIDLKYAPQNIFEIYSPIKRGCSASGIFNRYDNIQTDDTIYGDYNSIPFKISDIKISYEIDCGESKSVVTVFNGLFLSATINKNFNGEILIKTERFLQPKEIWGKKTIRLEDVEFEKNFEVYSTDQIEARYVLTTAFMNRLLSYKRSKNYPIEVIFSNKIFTGTNIFFFINTNKNHFEIPITKSLLDKKLFFSIISEIIDILEIIDTLKLNQNIGL